MARRISFTTLCITIGFLAGMVLTGRFRIAEESSAAEQTTAAAPASGQAAAARPAVAAPAAVLPDLTSVAQRVVGSVTNISSTQIVRGSSSPFENDPFFRYFFGDDDPFGNRERRAQSLGSGVIVSADGYLLTNNHVIGDVNAQVSVVLGDKREMPAKVVGVDEWTDIAVLKVDAKNLPTVKLGNSDSLQVGDQVVAVGNALALEGGLSVTQGIISGKGRVVPEDETGVTLYDMLQTDAAINPGNSGGPLVNAAGEVVGINTALAGGSQNVGFAISIDSAKSVISALRAGKSVQVAFLGVETTDVTPAVAKSLDLTAKTGAVGRRVTKDAAADKAGMKANDVIVAIGGHAVSGPQDVGAEIRRYAPGDEVDVTVERGSQQVTLKVTLGARPDSVG